MKRGLRPVRRGLGDGGAIRPSAGALAFLAVFLSGCATGGIDLSRLPVEEYEGHLTWTGRSYEFKPCEPVAGVDRLWVTATERSVAQLEEARRDGRLVAGRSVYVRWLAALAPPGTVGPGGPALLARDVLDLRRVGDSDCRAG